MMAMTTVFRVCPFCGQPNTVQVDEDKYTEYITGDKNIQNVFPELTPDERECILTGYHPKCWDEMWEDIKIKRVMKEGEG